MERLTERYGDGYIAIKGCTTAYSDKERKGAPHANAIVRLAAYEDTNLTPADINDLRNELCLKCGKYKDAHLGACDGCRWRKEEVS